MKIKMNVIRAIEIDTISEDVLLKILRDHIQKQLPSDAKLRKCEFSIKRNPTRVELECDAVFGDYVEPVKKETKDEALEEKKEEVIAEHEKKQTSVTQIEKDDSLVFEPKDFDAEDEAPKKNDADPLAGIFGSNPETAGPSEEKEEAADTKAKPLDIAAIFS